ncbi:uncharacterized protein [Blastocystis hominis]|uniref:Uncharacterized protein n=1 Tax=Blastocystis hominis TaxID=12968 RepID=D8LXZ9_BLAHO|nr:uncharacterized protein [Blastocystis hominis]CBK20454.2 unnamed protein product [Blastocystis hominis]|eukprot:XP_012894502.1 uncharacterized protein [Blastocystis hominis]
MIRREYHPSSKIDALILKKKLKDGVKSAEEEADRTKFIDRVVGGLERDEALHESNGDITTVEQLDVEDHPERNIPDIPENKRVRDFLRSMPLTGHGAAFGKTIYVVQCYRCKCYGHRAGDPECKYTVTGDLNLELQSRIREDPIRSFKPLQEQQWSE